MTSATLLFPAGETQGWPRRLSWCSAAAPGIGLATRPARPRQAADVIIADRAGSADRRGA
jgi:hypothetical protein